MELCLNRDAIFSSEWNGNTQTETRLLFLFLLHTHTPIPLPSISICKDSLSSDQASLGTVLFLWISSFCLMALVSDGLSIFVFCGWAECSAAAASLEPKRGQLTPYPGRKLRKKYFKIPLWHLLCERHCYWCWRKNKKSNQKCV